VTPGQQNRRETTEEMRRRQQADEKIRELEQEIERYREALQEIIDAVDGEQSRPDPNYPAIAGYARGTARRALDGKAPAALGSEGDNESTDSESTSAQ